MIKYFCDNCGEEIKNPPRYRDTELLPMNGYADSNFAIVLNRSLVYLIICEDCKHEICNALSRRKKPC